MRHGIIGLVILLCAWITPAQAQWTNAPTGTTLLSNHNFDTRDGNGWSRTGGTDTIVVDATATISPSNVVNFPYPIGYTGAGVSPAKIYYPMSNQKSVYWGYNFKASNPWQGHDGLFSKMSFISGQGFVWGASLGLRGGVSGPFQWWMYFPINDGATSNAHIPSTQGDAVGTRFFLPNVSNPQATLGVWHTIEQYIKCSTTNTSQDGIVRWWVDGNLVGNFTTVNMPATCGISEIQFDAVWGGNGGSNKTQADYFRWDHTYLTTGGTSVVGGGGDTTPPGIPVITTSASGGGQGNVEWPAVTDNVGVQGYEVLRCTGASCTPSTIIGTTTSTVLFYTDLTLSPSTTYRYAVRAFDAAGNRSGLSNLGSVTTTATFKSTLATDTFTRADNTDLGASYDAGYTGQGPCQIVSNRMRSTTINTRCWETYNATVPGNDQWAQRTISNLTGAQLADQCVLVRAANAATVTTYAGCALVNGSNTYEIREYTTGTPVVSAGNATYTVAAGDKIRLEAEGTTLRLYRVRGTQETLVTSTTDASIASGKAGVTNVVATSGTLSNNESDDLVVGDFGAGTATTVGFESVSNSPDNETSNTTSWSHTTTASSNAAFIGCAYARSNVESHTQVQSYTLGGQPLTFVRRDTRNDGASNYFTTEIWRLFGPSVGSATATIVWGGTPRDFGVGTGIGLTNVSAAAGVDAHNGSSGTGATASVSLTTVADHAAIVDCAIGRSDAGLTVGAGQTMRADRVVGVTEATNDGVGASTVLDKTPAGAETMDWTQTANDWVISAVSVSPATVTPVIPPTIATLTLSASGATLTAGATTPTRMRVAAGNNANTLSFADNVAWSTSYSKTWPDGYEFACFYPIDSAGVENTDSAASKCGSLVGIVQPLDTTPIVMTQTFPTTTLNQGTTSSLFTISLDKAGECKWDTSNTTYALMANTMNVSSLSASADTGAVLSNGTTSHFYTQCQFANSAGDTITTTTALDVSISVAAGAPTDTTKPSTIADLAATALTQAQVLLIWPAATDANGVVSYNIYLCSTTTTCTPQVFAGATGNVTQTVLNLSPLTGYCFDVRGVDPSNNEALASNAPCVTTTAIPDIEPPSTMQNLRVVGGPFTASVILGWDQGDGTPGQVTSTIEQCTGTGCSDFTVVQSNITTQQLQTNLTPGVLYRFRGIFTDLGSNRSLAYSNIVEVTTTTTGVDLPRGELPFGATRETGTRDAYPTTRDARP